jgi:lipopolysaccharide assembly outer membrane protein LptD (OstA)
MLISLFSLLALGTPILPEETASSDQLPEIKICANNGNIEVRIGDYKISGTRVTIDPQKQRLVAEGGDQPATLVNLRKDGKESSNSGRRIVLDFRNSKYTVMDGGEVRKP